MRYLKNITIRQKLISIIMATCIAALVSAGTLFIVWEYITFRQNMIHHLTTQAEIIADNSKAALAFEHANDAKEILGALKAETSVICACITLLDGQDLANYYRGGERKSEWPQERKKPGHYFEKRYLILTRNIELDGEMLGTVCLISDLHTLHAVFKLNFIIIIGVVIFVLALVYPISSKLQKIISEPILNLAYIAKNISENNDYSFRAAKTTNDEIGTLIESFNNMVMQIQHRDRELVKARDHLEIRVNERTAQLENAKQNAENARSETEQANLKLRISMEQAQLMAKEANRANMAKSEFLANMSHEIRTPMNAIIGFSQVLAEEDLSNEQKKYINTICTAGENLLSIINDVLDFSKIESGKMETEIADCELTEILENIESLLRPAAQDKNLDFQILQCDDLPQIVRTDPAKLRQCLINLVNNAIKFTNEGHIYVNIALEYNEDNKPFIRFDIEDTGIGIPEDKQSLIFESFSQADSSTTRKYGGTGLGLAISKQLIELLGGKISLSSTPAKGSVFTITIPANVNIDAQKTANKYKTVDEMEECQSNQIRLKGKVLVAEDAPANQMLIKTILEKLGIEATITNDGMAATFEAIENHFDLIFMDIQMPKMNGYEATKAIREQGIKIPIIALTANALQGDDKKCYEAGCNDYIPKPLNIEKIRQILAKYLPLEIPVTKTIT